MLPCIGSQTQATSTPAAVTFSTRCGSPSRIRPAPKRVMKVSRPGSLSGLSRAASASASSAVVVGPSLTPIGLRMWRSSSTWAPSSWRVRSPIQTKWPETSYGVLGARVDAGHRVLVLQHQRLVAGVEVDPVELVGVGADRLHERQRAVDLVGHAPRSAGRPTDSRTKSVFQACTWRRSA